MNNAEQPSPWLQTVLPASLHTPGPLGLELWQWVGVGGAIVVGGVVGFAIASVIRLAFMRFAARTEATWDDKLLKRGQTPLTFGVALALIALLVPLSALPERAQAWVEGALQVAGSATVFLLIWRSIDIIAGAMATTSWAIESSASRTLIPIGSRTAKVVTVFLGVATVLSILRVPVASIVAGLGVGGLAVALAAQKSFENLLGAFALGVDQPCREGDLVTVGQHTGIVEQVGLRSTRLRTADRTVVTIPNGQFVEQRIETLAARDRIKHQATLGLLYSTTESQMRQLMAELERVLREDERIFEDVFIRFVGFGASSLDVEVLCWVKTTEFAEFARVRSELNLRFMAIVQAAGSGFAFPTRTVHVDSLPHPGRSDLGDRATSAA
jgi:MscS family membrane protein